MAALECYRFEFRAMGTMCSMHLYGPSEKEAGTAAHAAINEIGRIEARFSRYRAESDLSLINQTAAEGGTIELDDETAGLVEYAIAAFHRSGGLFDVTSGILRRAWDFRSGSIA